MMGDLENLMLCLNVCWVMECLFGLCIFFIVNENDMVVM